jgi:alpha-tubulin suppressor-like RCC1 family protein
MKKAIYIITLLAIFSLSNTSYAQPLAGGRAFTLAVCDINTAWAWGYNSYGQLGNRTKIDSNVPVSVNALTGITDVSCGDRHSLALKNDGTI